MVKLLVKVGPTKQLKKKISSNFGWPNVKTLRLIGLNIMSTFLILPTASNLNLPLFFSDASHLTDLPNKGDQTKEILSKWKACNHNAVGYSPSLDSQTQTIFNSCRPFYIKINQSLTVPHQCKFDIFFASCPMNGNNCCAYAATLGGRKLGALTSRIIRYEFSYWGLGYGIVVWDFWGVMALRIFFTKYSIFEELVRGCWCQRSRKKLLSK